MHFHGELVFKKATTTELKNKTKKQHSSLKK
jgi:hypothetical protein